MYINTLNFNLTRGLKNLSSGIFNIYDFDALTSLLFDVIISLYVVKEWRYHQHTPMELLGLGDRNQKNTFKVYNKYIYLSSYSTK